MNRIVIVGGYGAVGRHAVAALLRWNPALRIVVAGRAPDAAPAVTGASAIRVDLTDDADLARLVRGADAVLMCAEAENARVASACLTRGVHYVDISATRHVLTSIEELDGPAREQGATGILSVGVAPGLTNLLAAWCAAESGAREVRIGVLLGSGEAHGPAAVRWSIDGLGELDGSWSMTFPAPLGRRTVYRFPFADQYTLPRTLGLTSVRTGLCLDSRLTSGLLAFARRPLLSRLLRRDSVRDLLQRVLTRVHLGGDTFAVTARSGQVQAACHGHGQSRVTALVAALLVRKLPSLSPGVRHIEHLVDPADFLAELATTGVTVQLGGGGERPRRKRSTPSRRPWPPVAPRGKIIRHVRPSR